MKTNWIKASITLPTKGENLVLLLDDNSTTFGYYIGEGKWKTNIMDTGEYIKQKVCYWHPLSKYPKKFWEKYYSEDRQNLIK